MDVLYVFCFILSSYLCLTFSSGDRKGYSIFSFSLVHIRKFSKFLFFLFTSSTYIFFFIELRAFSGLHFLYAFTEINSFLSVLCVWWKATKGNGFFVFCFLALEEPLPRV